MPNVTVIGGGNMGSVLAVKFSQKQEVTLFLNNPYEKLADYKKDMKIFCEDGNCYLEGRIHKITDCLEEAVQNADWIFVTFPSFLFEDLAKRLIPLLHEGQHLVGIPGSGGFELFFKDALCKGVTITGLQRVHAVARVMVSGKMVRESGLRSEIRCASIPASFNEKAAAFLSNCYAIPVNPLENYLNITLVNSNPILHTARLFSVFQNFEKVGEYEFLPLFYEDWSPESSELLVKMDEELFKMLEKLKENGMPVRKITTLLQHYESNNPEEMTKKLRSIQSLKGLATPSIQKENGKLVPDFKSRYFTADFPFGLDILLSFRSVLNVAAPNLQKVSNWYHRITKTERVFSLERFSIYTPEDLKSVYMK